LVGEAAEYGDLSVVVTVFSVDDCGLLVEPGGDPAAVGFFDHDALVENGERCVVLLVSLVLLDGFAPLMGGIIGCQFVGQRGVLAVALLALFFGPSCALGAVVSRRGFCLRS